MTGSPPSARLSELARRWKVVVEAVHETTTSLIAFGVHGSERVAMKVVRDQCDEWHSGEVLAAFGGRRFACVLEHTPGAVLMERLEPGTALADLVRAGRDDQATEIIASVAEQTAVLPTPSSARPVEAWIASFARYAASGDEYIDAGLIEAGASSYARLCASQRTPRLLHGDLQHYNVLSSARGWVAIDPKGVMAEPAFEAGALLRNPHDAPQLMRSAAVVRHRADRFAKLLALDSHRVLEWCFAQAVLSLVWSREDGQPIEPDNPSLVLARTMLPLFA